MKTASWLLLGVSCLSFSRGPGGPQDAPPELVLPGKEPFSKLERWPTGPYHDAQFGMIAKPSGPVREEVVREDGQTACPFRRRTRYDELGRPTEIIRYDTFERFDYREELDFDSAGRWLGSRVYSSLEESSAPSSVVACEYDPAGRVVEIAWSDDSGDSWVRELEYDDRGRLVREISSAHADAPSEESYVYDDRERTVTVYTELGERDIYVSSVERYDLEGELFHVRDFDATGTLEQETLRTVLPDEELVVTLYKRTDGSLWTLVENRDGETVYFTTFPSDSADSQQTRYVRAFDERGNWVRKEEQGRGRDGRWDAWPVLLREIRYYE